MCGLHVSFWSSIRPRYFTSFLTGSCVPFIVTTGQSDLPNEDKKLDSLRPGSREVERGR